ncbi:MAG TPA: Uma2 family endonuclease [Gemmataceae bacterium]|jgi:Uma2 family endonuclease|nr:Uma2 family endonuclease [Gemmataceae bacterium]
MSVAEPPARPKELRTLADVLDGLGGIPAERILMRPAPGMAKASDVVAALDGRRMLRYELVDGVLVELPIGLLESFPAAYLIEILGPFVRWHKLGIVAGADGSIRLTGGKKRIPDVAFYSWARFPDRRLPKRPVPDLTPSLAIEVVSLGNTVAELTRKRAEYFRSGVQLVWQVDPRTRTVAVYKGPKKPIILREGDILSGGSVLAGFTLPVSELFGELDRHG